jgi:NOL1/NOP2/fmu family ribosome biogenesis protein
LGAWSTGYHIGTRKHEELEPSPSWAFSGKVAKNLPTIELSKEIALDFLRKNDLASLLVPTQKGWYLATYNGLGLGWLKALPTRWNNYYPSHWRIRHL